MTNIAKSSITIQRGAIEHPVHVFDVLAVNDFDVRKEPLLVRKQLLRKTLGSKQKRIAFVDFVEEEGQALY